MPETFTFPAIEKALSEPNGLLAQGGNLATGTLVSAYSQGIFPWYDEGQPLLWWSPDPRAVILPGDINVSRSLRKTMRRRNWQLSVNTAFADVIRNCADERERSEGTWITADMLTAYQQLHDEGYAHSVEVWEHDSAAPILVGGIYGVGIGRVFSGESMFHRATDASKVAVAAVCQHLQAIGWDLLDCQVPNPHLSSLGATLLPRAEYATILQNGIRDTGGVKPSLKDWKTLEWTNTIELEGSLR